MYICRLWNNIEKYVHCLLSSTFSVCRGPAPNRVQRQAAQVDQMAHFNDLKIRNISFEKCSSHRHFFLSKIVSILLVQQYMLHGRWDILLFPYWCIINIFLIILYIQVKIVVSLHLGLSAYSIIPQSLQDDVTCTRPQCLKVHSALKLEKQFNNKKCST